MAEVPAASSSGCGASSAGSSTISSGFSSTTVPSGFSITSSSLLAFSPIFTGKVATALWPLYVAIALRTYSPIAALGGISIVTCFEPLVSIALVSSLNVRISFVFVLISSYLKLTSYLLAEPRLSSSEIKVISSPEFTVVFTLSKFISSNVAGALDGKNLKATTTATIITTKIAAIPIKVAGEKWMICLISGLEICLIASSTSAGE